MMAAIIFQHRGTENQGYALALGALAAKNHQLKWGAQRATAGCFARREPDRARGSEMRLILSELLLFSDSLCGIATNVT
jgi:hypothetical protein